MEKQIKRTRGRNPVHIDGRKLEACIRMRGFTLTDAAKAIGITLPNLCRIKKVGSITEENRQLLRNKLGINEEEYVSNFFRVADVDRPLDGFKAWPDNEDAGTTDWTKAPWACQVAMAKERNQRQAQEEEVILLRRDELKSIVKDAVLDVLRSMVGGAAS